MERDRTPIRNRWVLTTIWENVRSYGYGISKTGSGSVRCSHFRYLSNCSTYVLSGLIPFIGLFLGLGSLLVAAGFVGYVSGRWALSVGGFLFLFLSTVPPPFIGGCLGCAYDIPENYVYWQHIRVDFTFSSPLGLGPATRMTAEPAGCICGCPYYYLPLIPVFGGYGLLLLAVLDIDLRSLARYAK